MTSPASPSSPRSGTNPARTSRAVPTPPTGWVVGSYGTYLEAQRAVDHLADHEFPVEKVTIVGVDLMQVERVTGRLTWGRVLLSGLVTGAWFGLFIGLMLGLFSTSIWGPLAVGIVGGAVFATIGAAISYSATGGQRDFASTSQLVANRYDILCAPEAAESVRDELYRLGMKAPGAR